MKKLFKPNQKRKLSSKLRKTRNRFLLLTMFLVFLIPTVSAQTIFDPVQGNYVGCTFDGDRCILPQVTYGDNAYSFLIPLDPAFTASQVTFSVSQQSSSCPIPNPNLSAVETLNNATGNYIKIVFDELCFVSDPTYFINFTVKGTETAVPANTEDKDFYIEFVRNPVKAMMVLDKSGSMSRTTSSGDTRWSILESSVSTACNNLYNFRKVNDLIGLNYFDYDVVDANTAHVDGFISMDNVHNINTDVGEKSPGGLTAMGAGLLDAKAKLLAAPADYTKSVLLFTDGHQNVDPEVNLDGNTFNTVSDELNAVASDHADYIKYFTISTWQAADAPEILTNIAVNNGGVALHALETSGPHSIEEFFIMQYQNMMYAGSPQIVAFLDGITNQTGKSHEFFLNKNLSTVSFDLLIDSRENVSVEIKKDGIPITDLAQEGLPSNSFLFNFPLNTDQIISSDGIWEFNITGEPNQVYSLSCIVDDHLFDYTCKTNKSIYTVGDTIEFTLDLSFAHSPVFDDTDTVYVRLFKPGDDMGNLLATTETPAVDSTVDMVDPAQQKFQDLLYGDTAFFNSIFPKEQSFQLTYAGNGLFNGSFDKTELTGIYKAVFVVNGKIPGQGRIYRTNLLTPVFLFGQVEPETPKVQRPTPIFRLRQENLKSASGTTSTNLLTNLNIYPKNVYGNLMGPGYKSRINVTVDNSIITVAGITDNLDGSYVISLDGVQSGTNPKITISIMGENFYEGKLFHTPIWMYILLIIAIVILLLKKIANLDINKFVKVIGWIILIIMIILLILEQFGIFII